ncbi:MAG: pyridoxamine 5'-phosphate oxidase family protein [Gemmatimonadaceae bacterium]
MDDSRPMPRFTTLPDDDARALLSRNHVGRLAFSFHDRVDIQPLHYVRDGDWLYGRTEVGSKLATLAHHGWCALETDEIRGLFDWDSVVVRGSFQILDPELGSADAYKRGIELLRNFVPGALTEDDPTPKRLVVFRIHIDEISGRSARR